MIADICCMQMHCLLCMISEVAWLHYGLFERGMTSSTIQLWRCFPCPEETRHPSECEWWQKLSIYVAHAA